MKARLSMAFQDLRGRDGTVVISKGSSGLKLTPWIRPTNPKSGPQTGARAALTKCTKTFEGFAESTANAWNAYGATQFRTNPITLVTYSLSGIAAFAELGTKYLQLNPNGTLPSTPPTSEFTGDTITVSAAAGTGAIVFTGSAQNGSGITTEVLIQKLASANRKPSPDAYVHADFKAFTTLSLSVSVPVTAGYYSVAYRFVKASTGQATPLVVLPKVTVALSLAGTDDAPVESAAPTPVRKKKAA